VGTAVLSFPAEAENYSFYSLLVVRKFLSLFLNKKKPRVRRNGHDVTIAMYATNQSDHFHVPAFNPYHVISSNKKLIRKLAITTFYRCMQGLSCKEHASG
jgi:hypothetical protein